MRYLILFALLLPSSFASGTLPKPREYRLRLFHTHTAQHLDLVYRRDAAYDLESLAKLDRFLGDHRSGTMKRYDPRLFDLLVELMAKVERPDSELSIICGYRTPASNEFLRGRSRDSAVARASLHMKAEAIDIRLPGVRTSRLRDTALAMGRGGVGYYAGSDFIHVDVGRVRRW